MSDSVDQEKTQGSTNNQVESNSSPVGQKWVGRNVIIVLAVYLIAIAVILIWGIIQLWPPPAGTDEAVQMSYSATFLFWDISISAESHLILIVSLAGAIGTQAHSLRSLFWYVGNRQLKYSWMMRYILMPFVGISLGLVFYFVIRGGFFAAGTSIQDLSPHGFVALAFLVGMFSEQAVERLKKVAEALFAKSGPGKDSFPPRETDE